jgi:hypothetical protein
MNAMKSRRFKVLAATVGLWLGHTLPASASPPAAIELSGASSPAATQPGEPSRLMLAPGQALQPAGELTPNQQLADTIAGQLRQSGHLKGYGIDIDVNRGVVDLSGQVADQAQREEVLRIVQGIPGVERVRDRLVVGAASVTPVTATVQPVTQEPRPLAPKEGEGSAGPPPGGMPAEPMPIFHAPPGAGMGAPGIGHMPPPPMPPYAWPTYAPYNNFSRVAYPTLYPYQSWPFIGPMYPFPKVPLGWRSVQLRWQDGHWWYGRTATGHDWWRVRYW